MREVRGCSSSSRFTGLAAPTRIPRISLRIFRIACSFHACLASTKEAESDVTFVALPVAHIRGLIEEISFESSRQCVTCVLFTCRGGG